MSLHLIFGLFFALLWPPASSYSGQTTVPPNIPKDLMITYEINSGWLPPSYKLTITADGAVVFKNKHNGTTLNGSISRKRLKELMAEFDRAKFFSLKEDYSEGPRSCLVDLPSAFISIRINGKSKTVSRNHDCEAPKPPKKLAELENKIDEIVVQRGGFPIFF
jgi:Domain of unknown function (DUF6438)